MTVYGLIIAIAVFIGFSVTLRRAPKFGIPRKELESLFLLSVPFAIIGARLYHVLSEFSYYQKNPIEMLYFWQGGWGIYGAIAGGILGTFIYTRFKTVNFWEILDLITPGVVLGQAIGRIGNIVNGELLPYAIYESILDFSIFLFFTFSARGGPVFGWNLSPRKTSSRGMLLTFHFSTYAILYGTGRFFLEFLRTEPEILLGLKFNQIVCLLFVGFGVISKNKILNIQCSCGRLVRQFK